MKCLNEIQQIISSYNLKPIELPDGCDNLYGEIRNDPKYEKYFAGILNDIYFLRKYKKNISYGHYGFSLGSPIVPEWCDIIDEVLELLINYDQNFGIKQIKIKFGRLCFYTESEVIEDLHEIEVEFLKKLNDKALIY